MCIPVLRTYVWKHNFLHCISQITIGFLPLQNCPYLEVSKPGDDCQSQSIRGAEAIKKKLEQTNKAARGNIKTVISCDNKFRFKVLTHFELGGNSAVEE